MVAPAVKESKKIVRKPLALLERKELDNGAVFCKVQNGGGFKYNIWIHQNGSTTCQQAEDGEPCPSTRGGRRCYHVQYALDIQILHEQQEAQKRLAAKPREINPVLYHDIPGQHFCHGRHWNGNYCYYGNHYINA